LDAALLELESDATEYGAEVANLFECDLIVGTSTTTVGIGQGLEGTPLEYYESRITEPELCDTTRGDFDAAHDFCVGVPGSTQRTGYGDSGGPLYILKNGPNAQYVFAGIVKGGVKAGPSGPEETENIRYTDVRKVRNCVNDITLCYDASVSRSTSAGNITTCGDISSDASLTDTYWRIDKLFDYDVIVTKNRREPHLILRGDDQNTVNATVGCNSISASFAHNGPDLTFGQGVSTRMACQPPLNQLEQQLNLLLKNVESFLIGGDSMVFLDSGGDVIANLTAVYLR
jgi:heat shock protein HslJ